MTQLSNNWIKFTQQKRALFFAPSVLRSNDISVIVPVRDNQEGVNRFLQSFFENHSNEKYPKEIILVDNSSKLDVTIPGQFSKFDLPLKVIRCNRIGPAYARNAGSAEAGGDWLLFTDSDCLPTGTFLSGYFQALNGAIAYAGNVKPLGMDRLSRYYASQEILIPPKGHNEKPQYLVTANALIWREGFEAVGGFDEEFRLAGGEDIDLGIRLSQIGELAYALKSSVFHDFGDGYLGFVKRFFRYGIGNGLLAKKYGVDLSPIKFEPNKNTLANRIISTVQYRALSLGYNWTMTSIPFPLPN